MSYPYDLGSYSRKIISTRNKTATAVVRPRAFMVLRLQSRRSGALFQGRRKADPKCAMAQWGIAYAAGPNYNKQWKAFDPADLARSLKLSRKATLKAQALAKKGTPVEQALIAALLHRYPDDRTDAVTPIWNDNYAAAMREVYAGFGDDLDVAALFAESIMNRTPWQLWNIETGKPAEGADTLEAIAVLEKAMKAPGGECHPGLLHMYVHLMEMSPHPERALKAADALRGLVPDAGHLQHMPTHIDVLCGHYSAVVEWNGRAIAADRKYLKREGAENFYSLYRCHDYHFLIYGAMFLGQYAAALTAAEEMVATLPERLLSDRITSDGRLAGRLRADEDARDDSLREMARDHRCAPARRPGALLHHHGYDALCQGGGSCHQR